MDRLYRIVHHIKNAQPNAQNVQAPVLQNTHALYERNDFEIEMFPLNNFTFVGSFQLFGDL